MAIHLDQRLPGDRFIDSGFSRCCGFSARDQLGLVRDHPHESADAGVDQAHQGVERNTTRVAPQGVEEAGQASSRIPAVFIRQRDQSNNAPTDLDGSNGNGSRSAATPEENLAALLDHASRLQHNHSELLNAG